jgi:DNA mismatch repair ATPase MutS
MNSNPKEFFNSNIDKYQLLLSQTRVKIRQTSILRLLVFAIGAAAIYISTYFSLVLLFTIIAIALIVFVLLVKKHLGLFQQKQWYEALLKVNSNEISILKMEPNAEYSGKEFIDNEHSFSSDLDIFGKKSLFRLINRTATLNGKKQLADALSLPNKNVDKIKNRQQAIAELKTKTGWRQQFQATGLLNPERENDAKGLIEWASSKQSDFNNLFYRTMLILNPLIGFVVLVLMGFNIISYSGFLVFLLMPFSLVGLKLTSINKEYGL